MRQVSILIFALFFLSSCEKETFVDYYIDNQSSSVISVDGTNIIASSDIDKTINPNEKKDVAFWSKRGKQTDFFEPTSMFGNDLIITNNSVDTLAKDYKLLSNWTSDVDDQRTVANHEYILVITDADF
ncbi:hypothetical protein N9L60_03785 [Flavobacteriales bacterium]|jgi:hypothetical protein|nr:hypothetical protein [Flavobacteriales bacterium]|tara:strand:- start:111 stop:494 length:384 start_codon:yes stop_codon:yes gene_type:complete